MGRQAIPIEEVLAEIEKLRKSPYVKLAKDTENHAIRQKLYALRSLDKRGRKIAELIGANFEEEEGECIAETETEEGGSK